MFVVNLEAISQDKPNNIYKNLTISAKIVNFEEIKKYLREDFYFQLAKLGENYEVEATVSKGYILVSSNFEKAHFINENEIIIQQKNIAPGKYLIALQYFTPLPKPKNSGILIPADGATLVLSIKDPDKKEDKYTPDKVPFFFLCNNEKVLIVDIPNNEIIDFNFNFSEAYISSY